jgi:hypothetical protein
MRRRAATRPGPLSGQKDHCVLTRPKPISSPGAPDVRAHQNALRPFVAWPRDPLTDRAAVGQGRDLAREDLMNRESGPSTTWSVGLVRSTKRAPAPRYVRAIRPRCASTASWPHCNTGTAAARRWGRATSGCSTTRARRESMSRRDFGVRDQHTGGCTAWILRLRARAAPCRRAYGDHSRGACVGRGQHVRGGRGGFAISGSSLRLH